MDVPDITAPSTNATPKDPNAANARQKIGQGLKNIAAMPLVHPNDYNPSGSGLESAPIGNVGNPFAIQNQPAAQYNPFAGIARAGQPRPPQNIF